MNDRNLGRERRRKNCRGNGNKRKHKRKLRKVKKKQRIDEVLRKENNDRGMQIAGRTLRRGELNK